MKTIMNFYHIRPVFFFLLLGFLLNGCDPFDGDGLTSPGIIEKSGYFYVADRGANELVMLDYGMRELKRWPLAAISTDPVALQGITFANNTVWLAFSGNLKFIAQVDATADTLEVLRKISVPPVVNGSTQGTVRGIAYDGQYLWVVNSGSPANTLSPMLFKMDPGRDSVVAAYPIPTPSPRGMTYVNMAPDVYGKGPGAGLYYLDNSTKKVHYFNTKVPLFDSAFTAPVPPAGTTWDQTLGITNDQTNFYTLSYSDIASYLFQCDYTGYLKYSYKLPYKYPIGIVWSQYDIRRINPPVVTTVSPAFGVRGTSSTVAISGSDFRAGLTVSFGPGIRVDNVAYINRNLVNAAITIDGGAVIGKRNVIVTNPDGRSGTGDSSFAVTAAAVTEYLFVTDVNYDSLFQIRIKDSTIVRAWSTKSVSPSHPRGLAYDGTHLWIAFNSSDYRIYKVDMSGATLLGLTSFPCPVSSGTVQSLTYYDGHLWLLQTPSAAPARGLIYKMNPANGVVTDTIATPGILGARGICFAADKLYCNDRDSSKVYSCNPAAKVWTAAFSAPAPPVGSTISLTGMFYNGTKLWCANSGGSSAGSDVLYEMSLSGQVLRFITAPYSGAAQPNGLVYIAQ